MVQVKVEYVIVVLLGLFLLYHFMGRCGCRVEGLVGNKELGDVCRSSKECESGCCHYYWLNNGGGWQCIAPSDGYCLHYGKTATPLFF